MNSKSTPLVAVVLAGLLGVLCFVFYQSSTAERNTRIQKEHEISQKIDELAKREAEISELNKSIADLRDTTQKKINALEMTARDREETAKSFQVEIETLKKEKDSALSQLSEKNGTISELSSRIVRLQREKDGLEKQIESLKREIHALQVSPSEPTQQSSPVPIEPYGMGEDKDVGLNVDPVNLGQIVVSRNSGKAARVQQVDPVYNFIIIDVGEKDGIREGAIMNVVRHNTLIGKAVVRHTRADASAALVLPEWKKASIEKGDLITKF